MSDAARAAASQAAAAIAADAYQHVVATLIRITGDWNMAEDCAQDALAAALERWPVAGVPTNPGGWLMTVARNRALDLLRRTNVERRKLREIAVLALTAATEAPAPNELEDDRLRLIFTCCHPALTLEARVALTLRTVCAVPTVDIARAFLVSESAMQRRLTRAKSKIAEAGIPYRVPSGPALTKRLPGVLAVLYLLFTNGYNPDGEPAFAEEAIRLARLLARLMPREAEASALLALMLLQHSRRDARRDDDGNLVNLEMQDRSRWDHAAIAEAMALLAGRRRNGQYGLQARIAACHATALSIEDTDWQQIADSYDDLVKVQASPVIELNRAVAHGHAFGPSTGLELLERARAAGALDGYPLAIAAEAHLRARNGEHGRAADLFRKAAALAHGESERRALLDRASEAIAAGVLDGVGHPRFDLSTG